MCNGSSDRISVEELKARLNLNSVKESLQDRRLKQFGHLERREDNAWSSKVEHSGLVVAYPEDNREKQGMR